MTADRSDRLERRPRRGRPAAAALALGAALALAAPAARAQAPAPPSGTGSLPVQLSGDVTTTGQLYGAAGIPDRWPGQSWTIEMNPEATLFGSFHLGFGLVLSSQGDQYRQNIDQFGLNPRFGWVTLHLGDFSKDYAPYTVQGTRVRGAGFDLRPGIFRFSIQGGRTQRAVFGDGAGATYARSLVAGLIGLGKETSSYVDLMVVKAKDDPSSVPQAQVDTLLLDTIPVALRPQQQNLPEENLVVGLSGQAQLLRSRLVIAGDAAGALITRDLTSPAANPTAVTLGRVLNALIPLKLSTGGDYAYHLHGTLDLGSASLKAGWQYVGPGYTSLGLSYLINDREGYDLGGAVRLFRNSLTLQGEVQHQNDNLLGQKLATTNNDALALTGSWRIAPTLTTTISGQQSVVANTSPVDTFAVNTHSIALTAMTAWQASLFGRTSVLAVAYTLQRTTDFDPFTHLPRMTVHNVSLSDDFSLTPAISFAPSLSVAATQITGSATEENVYAGFRGQVRLGKLHLAAGTSQAFSAGRRVSALTSDDSYLLPWQSRLSLQVRYTSYTAYGSMPAFAESFATLTVSRSF